jgi:hypothetical protein
MSLILAAVGTVAPVAGMVWLVVDWLWRSERNERH